MSALAFELICEPRAFGVAMVKRNGRLKLTAPLPLPSALRDRIKAAKAELLHFMFYNFCRIHKTLRVPPATQAGVADYVWTLEDVAQLAD